MFVNFSQVNSSLVPLILNTATFKRSPQYHVVFDDKFATINSLPTEDSLDNQWARIFKLDRVFYLNIEYTNDGNIKTSDWPRLNDKWLDTKVCGSHILTQPPGTQPLMVDEALGGHHTMTQYNLQGELDCKMDLL